MRLLNLVRQLFIVHPNNIGKIEKFVPNNIYISCIKVINSSKLVVGNCNTVLFTAHLTKACFVSKVIGRPYLQIYKLSLMIKIAIPIRLIALTISFKIKSFKNNSHIAPKYRDNNIDKYSFDDLKTLCNWLFLNFSKVIDLLFIIRYAKNP